LIGPLTLAYLPPDENAMRGQIAYIKEQGNKAPRRRPGDRFTLFGALVGIIVGILLSWRTGNLFIIVACAVVGGIIGTLIGTLIGSAIIKRQKSREKYGDSYKNGLPG